MTVGLIVVRETNYLSGVPPTQARTHRFVGL